MILSVSRRTDIPACYAEWFMNRLRDGFVMVRNPMNPRQVSRIALTPDTVECIVFWSKNPAPLLPHLDEIGRMGFAYLLQMTLNAYGTEVEAGLPPLRQRMETLRAFSGRLGKKRVIWRYDPILLSERYTVDWHIARFEEMAEALQGCTEQCVISFLDVYDKIRGRLRVIGARSCTDAEIHLLAGAFSTTARRCALQLQTCAEKVDLASWGIRHGACIDGAVISDLLGYPADARKDANQREACGCMASVDIGAYNTCRNGCAYCYANHSPDAVARSAAAHDLDSPLLTGKLLPDDRVTDRAMPSVRLRDGEQLTIF